MKKFLVAIKGKQVPDLVEADERKIVTEEGIKFHQLLANGEEVAVYPVSQVQVIRAVPDKGDDSAGAEDGMEPVAPAQRVYPVPRV